MSCAFVVEAERHAEPTLEAVADLSQDFPQSLVSYCTRMFLGPVEELAGPPVVDDVHQILAALWMQLGN